MKNNLEKNEPMWSNFAGRIIFNIVAHPFDYAKFLIQIGYEPIPPWPSTTFWGKPALALPNIFQYINHIKRVDGVAGCYQGFVPKCWAYCIYSVTSNKCIESITFKDELNVNDVSVDDLEDNLRDKHYAQEFLKNLVGRTVGLIVTHPFDVICVRMMAQFVGKETKYVTLLGSVKEIYKVNGLSGFYSGFIPRIIGHTITLALVSASTYYINKYVIKDDLRAFTYTTMSFLASTITYPFLLVTQCMAVNDCGLAAGKPPMMPYYADWQQCWRHLSSIKQLKRGSSVMWRTINLPSIEYLEYTKSLY
ncbi:PREDICTED: mitochondrial carrier homolog 2 [Ceratosolen solmsi marchali]|uniref:Mitochondrial carrier homolog 2 n=1 Tax=Ceratosolen solmsi marchali TaxID=326594 RepID=A0AAJ6VMH3_9HYME|nr:PREDICTED: mitochondrial carrier homolog 2 [Ceratosolen solmsi marchali]